MGYKLALLCAITASTIHATGIYVDCSIAGEKTYTITNGVFTRQTGFMIDVHTDFGKLKTEIGIKYKTADIVVHKDFIELTLSDSMIPVSRSLKSLLPLLAKATAHILRLEIPITPDESLFLTRLFENDEFYTNIAEAPRAEQYKFLDLMHFMQRNVTEIRFEYSVPFWTRVLYALGLSNW